MNYFLEHYYCTGDEEFLRNRMLPLYKELALLYFDYLTHRDSQGNYIFVPSYSPENFPQNYGSMLNSNAAMDVAVCREVMTTLLAYGDLDEDFSEKCREILDHLPPYMIGENGEIKEWMEKDYEERYDHRHISHLYGVYPGDEFQPEADVKLYKAARYTNRMRGMENNSCHIVVQRAQIAARLKDSKLVEEMLTFFLEGGYVTESFGSVHNPYFKTFMPDGQGAFPTIVMESLLYSRPGFIEILPAADTKSFEKGRIEGMSLRTFGTAKWLEWDGKNISFCFDSAKEQEIRVCYRKGIRNLNIEGGELIGIDDTYADIKLTGKPVVITMER